MMEYLADIVIEAFHETDDELRQTSALGVLQIVDSSNIELPAKLMQYVVFDMCQSVNGLTRVIGCQWSAMEWARSTCC